MAGNDADLVILGAGVSGLMLATRLAAAGSRSPGVMLIEPREAYPDDQTWSFWRTAPHRFDRLVEGRWGKFRWSISGWRQTLSSRRYPYESIPARPFFDWAEAEIAQSPAIMMLRGRSAWNVSQAGDAIDVTTDAGSLRARWVIDTRPLPPVPGTLVQRFAGARIRTGAASFEPSVAGLMDAMTVDRDGFGFTYVLPFAADEALVETTRFTTRPVPATQLQEELAAACGALSAGGYTVVRRESGAIPMSVEPPPVSLPGVVFAGRRGGGARPSTGYAFLRMDRWSSVAADALLKGEPPPPHPADAPLMRLLDGIFLQVLSERPELTPDIFLSLAGHAPADRLIRFLSDQATPLDLAAVIAALPPLPFLRAATATVIPLRRREALA